MTEAEDKTAPIAAWQFLESLRDGFGILDDQWCYRYINHQQAQLLGVPQADIVGQNLWQLAPEWIEKVYPQLQPAIAHQTAVTFEYFDAQRQTWVEFRATPTASGLSLLTLDIQARKQTDLNQQYLERLAAATSGLLYLFDIKTERNVYINERSLDLLGYSPEQVIVMGSDFMHQVMHPQDHTRMVEHFAQLQQAEANIALEIEYRMRHISGEWRWFRSCDTVWSRTPDGQVRQILGTAQDITAQRVALRDCQEAETALRESETKRQHIDASLRQVNQQISLLIESASDGFIALNRSWCYTYVNPAAAQMLGRSPESLLGQNVWEVFPKHPQLNTITYQQFHHAVAAQVTVEFEILSPELNCWLEIRAFPYADGLAVCFRDITVRKQEEQRHAAQYAVTRVLAEAQTLVEAVPAILQALCESLEWQLGIIWRVDPSLQVLHYVNQYQVPTAQVQEFIQANQQTTFTTGVGLPGQIWATRQPIWIPDIAQNKNFPRAASATKGGLRSALGFPIILGREILGVIECFSDRVQEPDPDLLQMMAAIGSQIGQFMERQRTEVALRQSQSLYQTLAESMPHMVWTVTSDGQVSYANQRWLEASGVTLEQVNQVGWGLVIHPEDLPLWHQEWAKILAGASLSEAEYRHRMADGSYRWFLGRAVAVRGSEGQLLQWVGTSTDIDDRKRVEAALRSSEERLALASQAAKIGTFEWDISTNEVYWSAVEEALYGLPSGSFQGRFENWKQAVHPEDRDRAEQEVLEAIACGADLNTEFRVVWPDGSIHWLATKGRVYYDAHHQPQRMLGINEDITDFKQIEAELRSSAEQFSLALSAAKMGDWSWDAISDGVALSPQAAEFFALPPGYDCTWTQLRELIHPQDRDRAHQAVLAAIAHSSDYDVEYRLLHPRERWISAKGRAQYDLSGQVLGMQGVVQDITVRKQAEAERDRLLTQLQAANMLLDTVFNNAPIGIGVWDDQLRYVRLNHTLAEINGLPESAHLGKTLAELLPGISTSVTEAFQRVIETGQALLNQEASGETPAQPGQQRYWRVDYYPMKLPGNITWIGAICEEITTRKQAEAEREQLLARERAANELLQLFIEHTPTAVAMFDREMHYLLVSQRWLHDYGAGHSNLIGLSHYAVIPDLLPEWHKVHQRSLTGEIVRSEEDYFMHVDGSATWIRWEVHPWYTGQGEIGGVIIFVEDITERKQAEQERELLLERERHARQQAEAANRIKDEFLAVLSHELRSPLNPILGWSKLLQTRHFDPNTTAKALETIERNARLQAELIEDLLDVSRILQGKMTLNIAPVSLSEVIEAAIETVRLAAEAKHIRIDTALAPSVKPVLGDASRLQQVTWNLLSNAVKFTPVGGQVKITLSQSENIAVMRVQDTGKGINPNFLPHVFEYFRQEDGRTTRQFGGLGLGLAIVRHLTELHGGTITVESPGEGLGATFTVSLPLFPVPLAPTEVPTSEEPIDLNQLKILAVDDEADMRELIQMILEQHGAEVKTATSAAEALTLIKLTPPDLLISDIGMPGADGYMLMRQIRDLPCQQGGMIAAIALTAYADPISQKQALEAGFQHYLTKPITPEALISAIVNTVRFPSTP